MVSKYLPRNVSFLEKKYNMGNIILIKDRGVNIKPLRSMLEAIQKLNPLLQLKFVEVLKAWLIF